MGAVRRHMGDRWHHIVGRWCYMGAAGTVWGPVSMWELCALYGSCVHRMGAMHAVWEPHGA
jgi:hypothetical protein